MKTVDHYQDFGILRVSGPVVTDKLRHYAAKAISRQPGYSLKDLHQRA